MKMQTLCGYASFASAVLAPVLGCGADVPAGERGEVGFARDNAGMARTSASAGAPWLMRDSPATTVSANAQPPVLARDDQTREATATALTPEELERLKAGGPTGAMRWLYPYEGTIFPRGLRAPLLMWEGEVPDAVYIQIKSNDYEYSGALAVPPATGLQVPNGLSFVVNELSKLPAQPQLQLPQEIWDEAGARAQGPGDQLTIEVTSLSKGVVAGPLPLHVQIAPGTLYGSVYYNSYLTEVGVQPTGLPPDVNNGGKVLRISANGELSIVGQGRCNGCHAVSANGSRMIMQSSESTAMNSGYGASYKLGSDGAIDAMPKQVGPRASFGALYPDGSKYLSTAVWPLIIDPGLSALWSPADAPPEAQLYDTETGEIIADTGITANAMMPMFSPDGRFLVFNDIALMSFGLALMDYDVNAHKASNYRVLIQHVDPGGSRRPGFPFFLPNNQGVIFSRTGSHDFTAGFSGGIASVGSSAAGIDLVKDVQFESDLHIVDTKTGQFVMLAKAMGFHSEADAKDNVSYLPFGPEEQHHNFMPTGLPVAAGGYFWIFFDSLRHYGNLGLQRQLWGAAIDIRAGGSYSADPSHPAFYLPGQEYGAANHRAYSALDACQSDGARCRSGIECCAGYCITSPDETTPASCGTPPDVRCAKQEERCSTETDCCGVDNGVVACIAGFCGTLQLL